VSCLEPVVQVSAVQTAALMLLLASQSVLHDKDTNIDRTAKDITSALVSEKYAG